MSLGIANYSAMQTNNKNRNLGFGCTVKITNPARKALRSIIQRDMQKPTSELHNHIYDNSPESINRFLDRTERNLEEITADIGGEIRIAMPKGRVSEETRKSLFGSQPIVQYFDESGNALVPKTQEDLFKSNAKLMNLYLTPTTPGNRNYKYLFNKLDVQQMCAKSEKRPFNQLNMLIDELKGRTPTKLSGTDKQSYNEKAGVDFNYDRLARVAKKKYI